MILSLFIYLVMTHIIETAGCIPIINGKIILVGTDKGNFIFPKGKIKSGETTAEAAIRETKEESGCRGEIFGDKINIKIEKNDEIEDLTLFKMHVKDRKLHFDEFKRRKLLEISPSDIPNNKHIHKYVKKIIKEYFIPKHS